MTSQDPDLHEMTQPVFQEESTVSMQDPDTSQSADGLGEGDRRSPVIEDNEEIEIEGIPFQHEDDETFTLRVTYEQALREAIPNLDEETITILASAVVKKARYGVNYEEDVEQLIVDYNSQIEEFYAQPQDV